MAQKNKQSHSCTMDEGAQNPVPEACKLGVRFRATHGQVFAEIFEVSPCGDQGKRLVVFSVLQQDS